MTFDMIKGSIAGIICGLVGLFLAGEGVFDLAFAFWIATGLMFYFVKRHADKHGGFKHAWKMQARKNREDRDYYDRIEMEGYADEMGRRRARRR